MHEFSPTIRDQMLDESLVVYGTCKYRKTTGTAENGRPNDPAMPRSRPVRSVAWYAALVVTPENANPFTRWLLRLRNHSI